MFTQPHWREAGSRGLTRPLLALGVLARGRTASTAVTIDKNQRLRCSNSALLHELAHIRKLNINIIYFMQNQRCLCTK
jgi:heat shock transcription factor